MPKKVLVTKAPASTISPRILVVDRRQVRLLLPPGWKIKHEKPQELLKELRRS